MLIAAVIAFFHQNHWLVRLENSAMDTVIEFNQGLPRMSDAGSAYSHWRFEALQLAHSYNLTPLELDLLSGNFPESDIGEMTSMSGLPDSGRQALPRDD